MAALVAKYKTTLRAIAVDSFNEAATRIRYRTPVDTGAARKNWKATIDGNVFYLLNDLKTVPYIRRLEYGWSPQAPRGMVRLTASEWPDIVRQAVMKNAS